MSQFNVYDIFGYLLPGAVVVGVLLFVFSPFDDLSSAGSFGGGLAMLLACYVAGHLLHATVGQRISAVRPSAELLSPDCFEFSPQQKTTITRALNSTFELDLPSDPNEEQQQAAFDLAYATVIQHDAAGYVPLYNSLHALYLGLLAASRVSFVVLAVDLAYFLGRSFEWTLDLALYGIAVLFVSYLAWSIPLMKPSPLRRQFDHYAGIFAISVYRNFLVWHRTKEQPA